MPTNRSSSSSESGQNLSFTATTRSARQQKRKSHITAGGEARFKKVYADGKYATKEYVDTNANDISISKKGSYLIFNCVKKDSSFYATSAIYWMEESSKVKLIVSCDALDDLPQISRDRYRGPDFAKTEWEAPISIMRLSGDFLKTRIRFCRLKQNMSAFLLTMATNTSKSGLTRIRH